MKKIGGIFVVLIILAGFSLGAQEPVFKNSLSFTASTLKEAKLDYSHSTVLPFLQGDGPLFSGNNMAFNLGAELSPVSVAASLELRLTPLAFMQFFLGSGIATGWNIPNLANGLCKNSSDGEGGQILSDNSLEGFVWSGEGGGLFQFDFAAIFPGEWNHVVFQTSHLARYKAWSKAEAEESWLYQADSGENRNGWNYYGSYFLGYQMPIFLQMAGVLVEENLYLYNTPGREVWGDDLGRWTMGALLSFKITDRLSANALAQFRTNRNFTEATKDKAFYKDRVLDTENPRQIEFFRAVLIIAWTL